MQVRITHTGLFEKIEFLEQGIDIAELILQENHVFIKFDELDRYYWMNNEDYKFWGNVFQTICDARERVENEALRTN